MISGLYLNYRLLLESCITPDMAPLITFGITIALILAFSLAAMLASVVRRIYQSIA
jgi:hypothetical protein